MLYQNLYAYFTTRIRCSHKQEKINVQSFPSDQWNLLIKTPIIVEIIKLWVFLVPLQKLYTLVGEYTYPRKFIFGF